MPSVQHLKKTIIAAVIVCSLCLAGALLFLLFPYIFDQLLAQRLLNSLSLPEGQLSISKLTPWQVTGSLRIGNESAPSLIVPKFQLRFSPAGLVDKRIDQLIIDSATVHLQSHNGKVRFTDFESKRPDSNENHPSSLTVLPLALQSIKVTNSLLTVHEKEGKSKIFCINSEFRVSHVSDEDGKMRVDKVSGDLEAAGDLHAKIQLELFNQRDNVIAKVKIQLPKLEQFQELLSGMRNSMVQGSLDLESTLTMDSLFRIADLKVSGSLSGFSAYVSGITLRSPGDTGLVNFFAFGNMEQLDLELTGLTFTGPQHGSLETTAQLRLLEKSFVSRTTLLLDEVGASASLSVTGNWMQQPPKIKYQLSSETFTLNDQVTFSPITVTGEMAILEKELQGHVKGRVQRILDKSNKISLTGTSFSIPIQFPEGVSTTDSGFLKIDRVSYKGVESGRVKIEFSQSVDGHKFTVQLFDLLQAELSAQCRGLIDVNSNLTADCNMPLSEISSESFPIYMPLPEGLSLSGKIRGEGQFSIMNKIFEGNMALSFTDGIINYGDNSLSSVDVSIYFPRLPSLQSQPSQLAHIDNIDVGDIHLANTNLWFRIEDDRALFIEKATTDWCNGKLETAGIRLNQNMDTFNATLYADRLGFSELIGQLGIDNTEGDGSLSGKIPIEINKQGIVFDDGFLYSTPGNSGTIRFHDTEQLRQGIPGLEQSSYLDYTMNALGNFAYNWTKLTFNSQGSDLIIAMQLDGKPATPLPFGYKKGQIVKTNKGPGLQHPIRLDVNLSLPLQDLFQYGDNIQSILENM